MSTCCPGAASSGARARAAAAFRAAAQGRPIYGYYHVGLPAKAIVGGAASARIYAQQMGLLSACGLAEASESIFVGVSGRQLKSPRGWKDQCGLALGVSVKRGEPTIALAAPASRVVSCETKRLSCAIETRRESSWRVSSALRRQDSARTSRESDAYGVPRVARVRP